MNLEDNFKNLKQKQVSMHKCLMDLGRQLNVKTKVGSGSELFFRIRVTKQGFVTLIGLRAESDPQHCFQTSKFK